MVLDVRIFIVRCDEALFIPLDNERLFELKVSRKSFVYELLEVFNFFAIFMMVFEEWRQNLCVNFLSQKQWHYTGNNFLIKITWVASNVIEDLL